MASMICCVARNVTFGCIAGERKDLLKFKASLLDPSDILSSWHHNKECCTWQGVKCNKVAGHVIGLNLSGLYKNLRVDDLMWATNLSSLEHLDMSGVNLSRIKHLVKLIVLDVGDNKLTGKLPEWNGKHLFDMLVLRLRNNDFNGAIPSAYCQLHQLQIMDLADNKLTGNLPHCFDNFSRMINMSGE
ncbi:hypothetical protein DH2020_005753 [Rehmannia glutinosa]|uniref:Leucine-rich repeat-containing N-terminal plant-type domain-containing protein n=1 Tax=Rehmannia glutinosa TaxID=99300 RepID=A0ABR0XH57_REHGL